MRRNIDFINMSSEFFSNSPDWVLILRKAELVEKLKARSQLITGLKPVLLLRLQEVKIGIILI
jgi:alpha-galactosidase